MGFWPLSGLRSVAVFWCPAKLALGIMAFLTVATMMGTIDVTGGGVVNLSRKNTADRITVAAIVER